jgi:hypothetical protein
VPRRHSTCRSPRSRGTARACLRSTRRSTSRSGRPSAPASGRSCARCGCRRESPRCGRACATGARVSPARSRCASRCPTSEAPISRARCSATTPSPPRCPASRRTWCRARRGSSARTARSSASTSSSATRGRGCLASRASAGDTPSPDASGQTVASEAATADHDRRIAGGAPPRAAARVARAGRYELALQVEDQLGRPDLSRPASPFAVEAPAVPLPRPRGRLAGADHGPRRPLASGSRAHRLSRRRPAPALRRRVARHARGRGRRRTSIFDDSVDGGLRASCGSPRASGRGAREGPGRPASTRSSSSIATRPGRASWASSASGPTRRAACSSQEPAAGRRRLLVVGDSVTCGENVDRAGAPAARTRPTGTRRGPYGLRLARSLGAEAISSATAGRGLTRDWQGRTDVRTHPLLRASAYRRRTGPRGTTPPAARTRSSSRSARTTSARPPVRCPSARPGSPPTSRSCGGSGAPSVGGHRADGGRDRERRTRAAARDRAARFLDEAVRRLGDRASCTRRPRAIRATPATRTPRPSSTRRWRASWSPRARRRPGSGARVSPGSSPGR